MNSCTVKTYKINPDFLWKTKWLELLLLFSDLRRTPATHMREHSFTTPDFPVPGSETTYMGILIWCLCLYLCSNYKPHEAQEESVCLSCLHLSKLVLSTRWKFNNKEMLEKKWRNQWYNSQNPPLMCYTSSLFEILRDLQVCTQVHCDIMCILKNPRKK